MIWRGKEVDTVGALVGALSRLREQPEADEFMRLYRAEYPENADANVGYVIGYIGGGDAASQAERERIHNLVRVQHPIFAASKYWKESA